MDPFPNKDDITFPLDCKKGLECTDYECEFRHLDATEQTRYNHHQNNSDGYHHPKSPPHLIVTASRDMGRSASTWVFNAVRLLCRQAREACDSYWIRDLTANKLRQRVAASKGAHVLIKTHECALSPQVFETEVIPMLTHVIVSVRDGFRPDPAWMKVATHVVPYEHVVAENPDSSMSVGALSVLRGLANHLGMSCEDLSDDDLRTIDYELMTLPIPGDQSTKFWSFHARRGGRAAPKMRPAVSAIPPTLSNNSNSGVGNSLLHVFVTRHGARVDNGPDRDPQWLERVGHGRPRDAPLSPHGQTAATELATALLHLQQEQDIVMQHIVSSPLLRCMETADAVAAQAAAAASSPQQCRPRGIWAEPGIAEVGAHASHMGSDAQLQSQFPRMDTNYTPVLSRHQLPDREYSDEAAAQRAERVAKTIVARHDDDSKHNSSAGAGQRRSGGGAILFVGHGATCLGLVRAFGQDGYVGYCSLSHFYRRDSTQPWQLVGTLGDVSHLSDPQTALDSAW